MIKTLSFIASIVISTSAEALMDAINFYNEPKNPDNRYVGKSRIASGIWHALKYPRDIFIAAAWVIVGNIASIIYVEHGLKIAVAAIIAYAVLHCYLRFVTMTGILDFFRDERLHIN